jgi:hypothetical protein
MSEEEKKSIGPLEAILTLVEPEGFRNRGETDEEVAVRLLRMYHHEVGDLHKESPGTLQ